MATSLGDLALDPVAVLLTLVTVIVFAVPILILFPPLPVENFDVLGQTHSKIGLSRDKSNLSRLSDLRRSAQSLTSKSAKPRVESLWIYPIKSCAGIELSRSRVLPYGLEHDRLYTFAMKVDPPKSTTSTPSSAEGEPSWKFQTQRTLPLLANVKVDLWLPDSSKNSRALGRPSEGFLVVKFPYRAPGLTGHIQRLTAILSRGLGAIAQKEFLLPLEFPAEAERQKRGYVYEDVKIWKEAASALNMGKDVPRELGEYLGVKGEFTLFRTDPDRQRDVFRCAPRTETLGYQPVVGFQDAYPLHLLSLNSLADLESKVANDSDLTTLDARRFRANIITSGSEAYEEDTWQSIRCSHPKGDDDTPTFHVSCRTVRCKMPNVDPEDGLRHKAEPDHALRRYRDVDPGAPKHGCLGVQMVPIYPSTKNVDDLTAFISVGMEIEVLETTDHVYIPQ